MPTPLIERVCFFCATICYISVHFPLLCSGVCTVCKYSKNSPTSLMSRKFLPLEENGGINCSYVRMFPFLNRETSAYVYTVVCWVQTLCVKVCTWYMMCTYNEYSFLHLTGQFSSCLLKRQCNYCNSEVTLYYRFPLYTAHVITILPKCTYNRS